MGQLQSFLLTVDGVPYDVLLERLEPLGSYDPGPVIAPPMQAPWVTACRSAHLPSR